MKESTRERLEQLFNLAACTSLMASLGGLMIAHQVIENKHKNNVMSVAEHINVPGGLISVDGDNYFVVKKPDGACITTKVYFSFPSRIEADTSRLPLISTLSCS